MTDRVAAKNLGRIAKHSSNLFVQIQNDLGISAAAVVEAPSGQSGPRTHLKSPLTEQIIGGEVVLHELVSPALQLAQLCTDGFQRIRNRGIVGQLCHAFLTPAKTGIRHQQSGVYSLRRDQRTNPDARPCASLANLSCKPLHIRKLRFVSPSIINHRIRTRPSTWTERSCEFSILENLLATAVSVCVIPVIRAVDHIRDPARFRAHHFAEFPERSQRILARLTPARDDSSDMKL